MNVSAGCFSHFGGSRFHWNPQNGPPCEYCISVCSLGRGIFMFLSPFNITSNTKSGPAITYVSTNINILESNFYSSDTCQSGTCKCGTSAECEGSYCISGVCEGSSFLNWCRNYYYFCWSSYPSKSILIYIATYFVSSIRWNWKK